MTERAEDKPSALPKEPPSKRRQREVIGRELRRLYDTVAAEPIPDDFLALLDQLEKKSDAT